MSQLNIETKFDIGDQVYTVEQIKGSFSCKICEGSGSIIYKGIDMKCPECTGAGYINTNKNVFVAIADPGVVSEVKVIIDKESELAIKYKIQENLRRLNRVEDNVFHSLKEAQKRCEELNSPTREINVDEIIIQQVFKDHTPFPEKVIDKMIYYKNNGEFAKPIRVNKDNVLQDGYIDYLLCKTFNIKQTKVTTI